MKNKTVEIGNTVFGLADSQPVLMCWILRYDLFQNEGQCDTQWFWDWHSSVLKIGDVRP